MHWCLMYNTHPISVFKHNYHFHEIFLFDIRIGNCLLYEESLKPAMHEFDDIQVWRTLFIWAIFYEHFPKFEMFRFLFCIGNDFWWNVMTRTIYFSPNSQIYRNLYFAGVYYGSNFGKFGDSFNQFQWKRCSFISILKIK